MTDKNNNFEEDLFRPVGSDESNIDFEEEIFQPVSNDDYNSSYIGEKSNNTEIAQSGVKIGKKVKIFFVLCVLVVLGVILNNALDFSLTNLLSNRMESASFEGREIMNNYLCMYEEDDLEHKKYVKIKSCEDGKVTGTYEYIVGANFDYKMYACEIKGEITENKNDELTIEFKVTKKDSKNESLCPETFTVVITDDYSTLKMDGQIFEKE